MRRTKYRLGVLGLALFSATACGIADSEACDEHQVYETGGAVLAYGVCVCDEDSGYVFDLQRGHGCKRCGKSQTIVDGRCVTPRPDAGSSEMDASSPPSLTGIGEPCSSAQDCASFDAKFCAPIINICRVDNCANGQNTCPSDSVCCDYGRLLAGLSLCVALDELEDGECAMGGVKVEP